MTALLAIFGTLIYVSFTDIRSRRIPNVTLLIIVVAGLFVNDMALINRIIGMAAVFIPLLILRTVGIGMGDVKLCSALAFTFGAMITYISILFGLIFAAICSRRIKFENNIPFAPFISGGVLVVFILEVIIYA